jgi:NNP family nitrate/nitrite transporter-like MFS transporter
MSERNIRNWYPENQNFWKRSGKRIATRNLIFSIFAEFLAFSIWQVWSAVAVNLPSIGFQFSVDQLFWLAALPGLTGATLRIPYALMVPMMGGAQLDVDQYRIAFNPGGGHWAGRTKSSDPVFNVFNFGTAVWFWRWQLCFQHGQHKLFFPQKNEGLGFGLKRSRWQHWR